MGSRLNEFGQPVGEALPNWTPREHPERVVLEGKYCRLEPIDVDKHAAGLYSAFSLAPDGRDWTYLFVGPFSSEEQFTEYVKTLAASYEPRFYAIIDAKTGEPVGIISLMRVDKASGIIEVGHITFSRRMRSSPVSTETQFLLMAYVFDTLGYRRYEWKCDTLNEPSRRAAARLGFQFEGIFRQALVYKGRTRDTAWHSILDKEWPVHKAAFEAWLAPANFDENGEQRHSLGELRKKVLSTSE